MSTTKGIQQRLIVKIPDKQAEPDAQGINGTAILLYSYPPTRKEPKRRKLALRLAYYFEITDLGRKALKSNSQYHYVRIELERAAVQPDGTVYHPMGRLIQINDNTIDELMDGLITAKEFLAGISEGITNERPTK